jgi:hypothetical protein
MSGATGNGNGNGNGTGNDTDKDVHRLLSCFHKGISPSPLSRKQPIPFTLTSFSFEESPG